GSKKDVSQDSEIHKITDLPIKSAVVQIDNDEHQIHNSCTDSEINNSNDAKNVLVQSAVMYNMHFKDSFYWPSIIDDNFISYCIEKGPEFFQNDNCSFEKSARKKENDHTRHLSLTSFQRKLPNGEKCKRQCILLVKVLYIVLCASFLEVTIKRTKVPFLEHQSATTKWLVRSNTKTSVNKEMCRQILVERDYWIQIFKRITTVIKFLAIRGLLLRGDHEIFGVNNNGNYLGLLELIANFDPFLKTHIELYGNKGKGNPSYMSKTICNEVINIMKNDLVNFIVEEVKQVKYFSIIMDSTPDLAKIDQMAIVFRYCISSKVYERLFHLT
ncbi:zinc finger MYM-type protein 1-like, partial [Aphis craccivora]